jgi:hypothetical protein
LSSGADSIQAEPATLLIQLRTGSVQAASAN